jgi:phosphate transport system substrate-binding protein
VPLPAAAYETFGQRARDGTTGTAFGGHQEVGASIEEVITRPLATAAASQ